MIKVRAIFILFLVASIVQCFGKPLYTFWDDLHIRQADKWCVKHGGQIYELDLGDIEIVFNEEAINQNIDSILLALNCVIKKVESRVRYYIKLSSGSEFFNLVKELSSGRLVRNISVKTRTVGKIVDTLITEVRLRDRLYLKKDGKWYYSQGGKLYEIVADVIALRLKKVSVGEMNPFFERNKLTLINVDRLGICNVKIISDRHAIFYFIDFFGNQSLDFIELITKSD